MIQVVGGETEIPFHPSIYLSILLILEGGKEQNGK